MADLELEIATQLGKRLRNSVTRGAKWSRPKETGALMCDLPHGTVCSAPAAIFAFSTGFENSGSALVKRSFNSVRLMRRVMRLSSRAPSWSLLGDQRLSNLHFAR
jgi:hypothetical protein